MPHFLGSSSSGSGGSSPADYKSPVRVASTANIATLSGLLTIDGVTLVAGNRVLVKDQTTAQDNGIYIAAGGAWSRATDADATGELNSGAIIAVNEGTLNADTAWLLTTNDPIVIGTTALAFGGTFVHQIIHGPLQITQGLAVGPATSGAFGSASSKIVFVVGSQTDGGGVAGNGGILAGARQNTAATPPANAPFTALTFWDWGSAGFAGQKDQGRTVYYGGGGWGAPDANAHQFYTSILYDETVDVGSLKFGIYSVGAVVVGSAQPGIVGALQISSSLNGVGLLCNNASQFNDRIRWGTVISPTILAADQNNYSPAGLGGANIVRQDASAPVSITGLATGQAGDQIEIFNITTTALNTITLTNEDAASTAGNRFILPGAVSLVIPAGGGVLLFYDGTSTRWRVMAKNF